MAAARLGAGNWTPPGVGKTHLAISLAIAATERRRRVYYGTLVDLINSLVEAKAAGRLNLRLKTLTHTLPSLLTAISGHEHRTLSDH